MPKNNRVLNETIMPDDANMWDKASDDASKALTDKLDKTGDASNVTAEFTQASTRTNLTTSEKISVSLSKISKWFVDFSAVAWSGKFTDLTNRPTTLSGYGITDAATSAQGTKADAAIPSTQKGAANGVATLDGSGLIPSGQLPSYVDDVLEYALKSQLPASGEQGKIYVVYNDTSANNGQYRWSGSAYSQISNSIDYATQAEAETGTENTKAMTALRVWQAITAWAVTGITAIAEKLQTARTIDGVDFDGSAAISHYGTCSTAAGTAAKTVALTGFKLVTGSKVVVKFTNANTATSPTLNINSTGAKNMFYKGVRITSSTPYLQANGVYEFVYDGTQYQLIADDSKLAAAMPITGYAKASSYTTPAATDTVNQAIGKLHAGIEETVEQISSMQEDIEALKTRIVLTLTGVGKAGKKVTFTSGVQSFDLITDAGGRAETTEKLLMGTTHTITTTDAVYGLPESIRIEAGLNTVSGATDLNDWQLWATLGGLNPDTYGSLTNLVANQSAMQTLAYSAKALNYMIPSTGTIMTAVVGSVTAMTEIGKSTSYAMPLIKTNSTWAKAVRSSANARTALNASNPKHVPTMTSNTAPSGVASWSWASPGYGGDLPYRVYDKDTSTGARPPDKAAKTGYHQYQFAEPIWVYEIRIVGIGDTSSATSVAVEASVDGVTFTEILSTTTIDIRQSFTNIFALNKNLDIGDAKYFRAKVTENGGSTIPPHFAEVDYYGK